MKSKDLTFSSDIEPREAFGVRRIPALFVRFARRDPKAPEYGALQTLRALVKRHLLFAETHLLSAICHSPFA